MHYLLLHDFQSIRSESDCGKRIFPLGKIHIMYHEHRDSDGSFSDLMSSIDYSSETYYQKSLMAKYKNVRPVAYSKKELTKLDQNA